MNDEKLLRRISDLTLNNDAKKTLILNIERMQKHRWARLKGFHNATYVPMKLRHFFMQKEIELIRSQKERQQQLIDDLLENDI